MMKMIKRNDNSQHQKIILVIMSADQLGEKQMRLVVSRLEPRVRQLER